MRFNVAGNAGSGKLRLLGVSLVVQDTKFVLERAVSRHASELSNIIFCLKERSKSSFAGRGRSAPRRHQPRAS
jgi:hypothetical protein